jgi:hypothetical protein
MIDRDPYRDDEHLQTGRMPQVDPTVRTTPRRAVWSWVTGIAIVFILFIVFYGLSSQRETGTMTTAAPPAGTTSSPPTTTGQGGGAQNTGAPAKDDAAAR